MSKQSQTHVSAENLNAKHLGDTVFIIGAGPQLAQIPDQLIRKLEQRTTVGVNMTAYRLRPTYFLSAYIGDVILAKHRSPATAILHMRPQLAPPLIPGILPIKRILFDKNVGLSKSFSKFDPTLFTKNNVVLGATHLAYILGARSIAYVGVEQRNKLHFWHFDTSVQSTIVNDLELLKNVPFLNIDHEYSTYDRYVEKLSRTKEECCTQEFYEVSHEETFTDYFDCLSHASIDIFSTVSDSVVCDAGANYRSLSDLLF